MWQLIRKLTSWTKRVSFSQNLFFLSSSRTENIFSSINQLTWNLMALPGKSARMWCETVHADWLVCVLFFLSCRRCGLTFSLITHCCGDHFYTSFKLSLCVFIAPPPRWLNFVMSTFLRQQGMLFGVITSLIWLADTQCNYCKTRPTF